MTARVTSTPPPSAWPTRPAARSARVTCSSHTGFSSPPRNCQVHAGLRAFVLAVPCMKWSSPIFPWLPLLSVRSWPKWHCLRKAFSDEDNSILRCHMPLSFPSRYPLGMLLLNCLCICPFCPTPTDMQASRGRDSAWHTVGTTHVLHAGMRAGQTPPSAPIPQPPIPSASRGWLRPTRFYALSSRRHYLGPGAHSWALPLIFHL